MLLILKTIKIFKKYSIINPSRLCGSVLQGKIMIYEYVNS
jgi:hypothetical protein